MAIQAIKYAEISCSGVALIAICPYSFMFPAVNREILRIMIPGRWRPSILAMATRTIGREASGSMIRRGCIVICGMATITCCRS